MTSHPRHDMHDNSLVSHEMLDERSKTEVIHQIYATSVIPYTDRQIMKILGFKDSNAVRPIVTKLIQEGRLREVGDMIDEETNRPVRLVTTIGLAEKPVRKPSTTEKLIATLQARVAYLELAIANGELDITMCQNCNAPIAVIEDGMMAYCLECTKIADRE